MSRSWYTEELTNKGVDISRSWFIKRSWLFSRSLQTKELVYRGVDTHRSWFDEVLTYKGVDVMSCLHTQEMIIRWVDYTEELTYKWRCYTGELTYEGIDIQRSWYTEEWPYITYELTNKEVDIPRIWHIQYMIYIGVEHKGVEIYVIYLHRNKLYKGVDTLRSWHT